MDSPIRCVTRATGDPVLSALFDMDDERDKTMVEMEKLIWWNGELLPERQALVPVTHLGWSGVEGVFEGMRGYYNPEQEEMYIFRLDAHMDRMMRSMRLMGLTCPWSRDAAYELHFLEDAPEGRRGSESCRVLAFVPERLLSFTWNAPPVAFAGSLI